MTNGVNNEVYEEEIIEDAPVTGLETPTEETPVVGVAYIAPPELGDLYLKFADEASASEALEGYEGSVDIIGVIYNVDNTDPENPVVTPMDGWHVNTRGPMPEALAPFAVVPTQPRRVWA
jgi:hypothetical protein